MSQTMQLISMEHLSDNEVQLVFYVLSRPDPGEYLGTLQTYYEDLVYGYAEKEGLKVLSNLEVELNPRNEGATLSFRARPFKKQKNFGWFKHQKRHYKAG